MMEKDTASRQKSTADADKTTNLTSPAFISKCLAMAVCVKNRNGNEEEYQNGVIIPYKKIQALQQELEATGQVPSRDQMLAALHMLKSVFLTKQVPREEMISRFDELFRITGMSE